MFEIKREMEPQLGAFRTLKLQILLNKWGQKLLPTPGRPRTKELGQVRHPHVNSIRDRKKTFFLLLPSIPLSSPPLSQSTHLALLRLQTALSSREVAEEEACWRGWRFTVHLHLSTHTHTHTLVYISETIPKGNRPEKNRLLRRGHFLSPQQHPRAKTHACHGCNEIMH